MITEAEKTFFEVYMDLCEAIGTNDVAAAPGIIQKINGMTLTEPERNSVIDTLSVDYLDRGFPGTGVCILLVEGLNCIPGKEYKVKVLRAREALMAHGQEEMRTFLNTALAEDPLLDDTENDRIYVNLLLNLCIALKDYDAMDVIRGKLVV